MHVKPPTQPVVGSTTVRSKTQNWLGKVTGGQATPASVVGQAAPRAQSDGKAQRKPVAHPVSGSVTGKREEKHSVGGRFNGGQFTPASVLM